MLHSQINHCATYHMERVTIIKTHVQTICPLTVRKSSTARWKQTNAAVMSHLQLSAHCATYHMERVTIIKTHVQTICPLTVHKISNARWIQTNAAVTNDAR